MKKNERAIKSGAYITTLVIILSICIFCTSCVGNTTSDDNGSKTNGTELTKTSESETESIVTPPGTFPVVKEKVTVKFFAPQSPIIEDIYENAFTKMYEEKTNVKIEWDLVPANAIGEMKQISFASGDYPDAYLGCGISYDEQMKYGGEEGIFIPLNDLIDKHCLYFKEEVERQKYLKYMLKVRDGNIYSFPLATYEESHLICASRYWINSYFLEKLGLKPPTTIDEIYEVFKAFKNNDPNNNGKQDEIPLVIPTPKSTNYFMCAFIYDDGVNRLRLLDGNKVDPVYTKDEWKQGLMWLNKLYREGLTDSTIFTLRATTTLTELVEKADAEVVGMVPGLYMGSFANMDGERQKHYDALPPLKGPNGVQLTPYTPYVHSTGAFVITKACKHPEILVRWVDWLYSFEGALTAREGPEGETWRRPEGGKSYAGLPATWERLITYSDTASRNSWQGLSFPHTMSMHGGLLSKAEDLYSPEALEDRLIMYTREYQKYIPEKILPPFLINPAVREEYSKLSADINNYVNETLVNFVTDKLNFDKDWDIFLSNLDKMGLNRYIEIVQEACDVTFEIMGQE